jgi:hypothetical protein
MKKTLILVALLLSVFLVQTGMAAELVVNGGFELSVGGAFAPGWVYTPAPIGPLAFVDGNPHTGLQAAAFGGVGPVGNDDIISQVLPTIAGQTYTISFWLAHAGNAGNNNFSCTFGGSSIAFANFGTLPYFNFSFNAVAPIAGTSIVFAGRDVPSWYYLDDVSVQQVAPIPGSLVLLASGLLGLLGLRRISYN